MANIPPPYSSNSSISRLGIVTEIVSRKIILHQEIVRLEEATSRASQLCDERTTLCIVVDWFSPLFVSAERS